MLGTKFKKVHIESVGMFMPEYQMSSAEIEDRLAPLYKKLSVPFGTLEKLSGVASRGMFSVEETPSKVSTAAAKNALDEIGFPVEEIKAVFNCSVTRDYFEPATAVLVHENLGFSESVMAMDITNACIGFSNGLLMLAQLIETGVLKAGLLVSGENLAHIMRATFERLLDPNLDLSRADFLSMMPTFTLGSGAVAMVLCHESIATRSHRFLGAVQRCASQHSDLCVGNGDFCFLQEMGLNPLMSTDSQKLIASAAKLGARTWKDAAQLLEWTPDDIDKIFCHQVGKQVNTNFYNTMGLPIEKEYTVYERYGNLVSAALPSAFITAVQENVLEEGQQILWTAFGSGLNSIFSGIRW